MSISLVRQLSYIVPAISIGFLFVITSINVYLKIRKNFPATVNCWFCNVNTKVPYIESNSWTCPSCDQYNGFAADGDYNRDIPRQRSSKLNNAPHRGFGSLNGSMNGASRIPSTPPSNGLCQPCNRNQELKMQQLATFEPENDAYFDEEVEDFRHKLEQAYRLCPRCERHLKRALNNVKKNILGSKLKQLGTKGLHAFNLQFSAAKSDGKVRQQRQLYAKLSLLTLVVLSLLSAYQTTVAIDINKTKLDTVFNGTTTAAILIVASYISAFKILVTKFLNGFVSLPYIVAAFTIWQSMIENVYRGLGQTARDTMLTEFDGFFGGINPADKDHTVITNVSGCLLSFFVIFTIGFRFSSIFSLILWTVSMLLTTQNDSTETTILTVAVDASSLFVIWALTIISIWNFKQLPATNNTENGSENNSFHRIFTECESDVSEESETESELNISLQSTHSVRSIRSERFNRRSFNRTSPISQAPSMFSRSTYAEQKAHRASMHGLDRASHIDLTRDLYDGNHSVYSTVCGSTFNQLGSRPQSSTSLFTGSANQLYTRDATTFNDRCSSRLSMNDIPDEFESGITQLSRVRETESRKNFRNNIRKEANESIASFGGRQRNSLLLPARLSYHENNHPDASIAANQSSWLAGGYWNNKTSPQKRQQHVPIRWYKANDSFPIISRTSSQSSGFESMKYGADSAQQQLHDEIDHFTDQASITRIRTDNKFKANTQSDSADSFHMRNLLRNQQQHPAIEKKQLFQNMSSTKVNKVNSFDTASLQQHLPFSNYRNDTKFGKYPSHFKEFKNELSFFPKGSLLKINEAHCSKSTSSEVTTTPLMDDVNCFDDL